MCGKRRRSRGRGGILDTGFLADRPMIEMALVECSRPSRCCSAFCIEVIQKPIRLLALRPGVLPAHRILSELASRDERAINVFASVY